VRKFLLIPAIAVVSLIVVFMVLDDPQRVQLFKYDHIVFKVAASLAALAAAFHFSARDYMFYAWSAIVVNYGVLALRDILGLFDRISTTGRHACVIIANVFGVIAILLFARAYRATGLEYAGEASTRRFWVIGGVLVALGVSVYPAYSSYLAMQAGNAEGVTYLVSTVGDFLSLSLIVPVLLTALSLRGGRLAWPWTLLVISYCGWLVFDILASIAEAQGNNVSLKLVLAKQSFRAIGTLGVAAAALAQRSVASTD
jgi:hypothetical protein